MKQQKHVQSLYMFIMLAKILLLFSLLCLYWFRSDIKSARFEPRGCNIFPFTVWIGRPVSASSAYWAACRTFELAATSAIALVTIASWTKCNFRYCHDASVAIK